ncbi:MAG: glycosyltransferase, partial [Chloroflexi bacterium]|nr:glycosyltransferase [Chloroflexota bacterium]
AFETDARQPRRWHAAAYSLAQWRRLRAFERRAVLSASATLSVSPQDAAMLARLDPSIRPHVIFNGIDVAGYVANEENQISNTGRQIKNANLQSLISNLQSPISNLQSLISNPQSLPTLVFTGKMDFRPNVDAMMWFGREVLPLVKQAFPLTRLLIVGQRPSPRLDALRADSAITVTGAVDDVRPYIAQATVYIAPLRVGGGTRFKLLEAMAMRRPIVSTTLGCEGFDVTSGRELLIGDTPADFADAVIQLLGDAALRNALARRAYDFVAATYDWRVIVPKLESIYRKLLS